MGDVDLATEFATFTRSAWRLCARDSYDVGEDERASIAEWRRSGHAPEPDNEWLPVVRAARLRGAYIGRVQVLSRPLTEYARWLLATYPLNVEAGEDVRIAYRDEHPSLGQWQDFWLFDDRRVAVLHYDEGGRFLGATDASDDLAVYLAVQARALNAAQPMGHAAVA